MTIVIGMEYAKQIFQEIIADEGDKQLTDGCMYVDEGGAPVCIVGHMLHRLGFRFKERVPQRLDASRELMHHEQNATYFRSLRFDSAFDEKPDVKFTPHAVSYIDAVQGYQDSGELWSVAVETGQYSSL